MKLKVIESTSTSRLFFQWINSTCAFTTSSGWLSYWYASRKDNLVNLTKMVCSALVVFILLYCFQKLGIYTFSQWVFHTVMSRIIKEILKHWRKKKSPLCCAYKFISVNITSSFTLDVWQSEWGFHLLFGLFWFSGEQGLSKPFFLALIILIFLQCRYSLVLLIIFNTSAWQYLFSI